MTTKDAPPFRVRAATVADAEAIGTVQANAWREAYEDLLPPAVMRRDAGLRARQWRTNIESGERDVFVSMAGGTMVGFCSLARSRDVDAPGTTGEVTALYVDPSAWRRGHGRALVSTAKEHAAARGWTELTLWVLANNDPARAFYAAMGFQPDGAERVDPESLCSEIRCRTDLRCALPRAPLR